jgi:NAD(P)-dependent dehydrogenase (short-subunit alcohol dehydrogenase family)
MSDLNGKVVLVTGGASGIGEASVELFAEKGATVVITDIDAEKGEALAKKLGAPHFFLRVDQADEAAWPGVLQIVKDRAGGIDFLFLNAGVMSRPYGVNILDDPLPWINKKAFDKNMTVNVAGPMYATMAAIPFMEEKGGTIIYTASGAGLKPYPQDTLYSVAKAATVFLAGCLGALLGPKGIRVMSISPHGIDTPMSPPDLHAKKKNEGTYSTPRHMAEAVLHAYEVGKSGEAWCGGAQKAPWLHDIGKPIVAGYAGHDDK